jgi:hypothetical protein
VTGPITLDSVERLDVRAGDVLWIKVRGLSPDVVERIREAVVDALPDVRVFVGDENVDVTIVRAKATP